MIERLLFLIYVLGVIPAGGLASAGLIEHRKRENAWRSYSLANRYGTKFTYNEHGERVPEGPSPEDRSISQFDRRRSMLAGYLLGFVWPFAIVAGAVSATIFGIGYLITKVAIIVGQRVLIPTTKKFEHRFEKRAIEERPEKLGKLEKLSS